MSKISRQRLKRKLQVFFKKNALALLICVTTVLTLSVIAVSAYFSLSPDVDKNLDGGTSSPVNSNTPVIFSDPLDDINILKDYAEDFLLEDKTTGIWQTHQAIDFSATQDSVVRAVYAGTIENVENDMMDGTIITLKINDTLKVVYKCLSSETLVSAGDTVTAGQEIGKAGTNVTEKADGVHIHLEVYLEGKLTDPNNYFSFAEK